KREAQLGALTASHAKLTGELEQTRKAMAAAQEAAEAKLRETSTALQGDREAALSKQKNEATKALEEAQGQIKVLLEANSKLTNGSEATIAGLRAEGKKIEAERDAAVKEREKAGVELAKLKADQEAQREQWERDLATARQGRELEAKALAEMRANREILAAE